MYIYIYVYTCIVYMYVCDIIIYIHTYIYMYVNTHVCLLISFLACSCIRAVAAHPSLVSGQCENGSISAHAVTSRKLASSLGAVAASAKKPEFARTPCLM